MSARRICDGSDVGITLYEGTLCVALDDVPIFMNGFVTYIRRDEFFIICAYDETGLFRIHVVTAHGQVGAMRHTVFYNNVAKVA